MKTVVFHPEASNPRIEFTNSNGDDEYTEVVNLQLAYGRVKGEARYQQIYVVEDVYYFHEHLMEKIREMEAESDVRIEPASKVEVENWM